jgi:hypothetical protein
MTIISKHRIFFIVDNEILEHITKSSFRFGPILKINFDFCIINISNIVKFNALNINKVESFKYFVPNNISELSNLLEENKDLAFLKLPINLKYHKIYRCLKKKKIKILSVSNLIFPGETKNLFFFNKQLIHMPYIIKKLNYYLYRLIVIFGFYPRIFCHFESNHQLIEKISNSLINKLQKFFFFISISYFHKIIRINTQYYSESINEKICLSEKYIVVCDTPISHADIDELEGRLNHFNIEEYYKKLFNFLKCLEITFKKNIIFCKHPKGYYEIYNNFNLIKKNFTISVHETKSYIAKAKFVLFQTSNTINDAIIMQKPILQYESNLLNMITKRKIMNFNLALDCLKIDIDNLDEIKPSLYKRLESNVKNQKIYRKTKLVFEEGKTDLDQITSYIKENIF